MRIGIDARLLTEPVTGIGRYTAELSSALLALDGEFILYTPRPPVVGDWSGRQVRVVSSRVRGRLGRMLWSQTLLPYQAARDRIDVFWGATHRLPRLLPRSVARVVTVHDLVWKFAPETMRPLSRWLDRRLMPQAVDAADRVIAVSRSTAQAIEVEWPAVKDKVRVVHPGATRMPPPADAEDVRRLGVDRPYFLFVGTWEPRKNLGRLLGAYARLPREVRAQTMLVIAGGRGWGGVDVDRMLAQMRLETDVLVTGYVSDASLSDLYAGARFLAMPSLYEGFGLPLVEAMSRGVPVLASDVSSLPEVAGDAGVLVDPLDEAAITAALSRLITDHPFRARLAARAVPNAQRFSWERAARETMAVFVEAVEERRALLGADAA